MYEQFRDELMGKLSSMPYDTIRQFMTSLDQVASHYEIKRAETQLIVYGNEVPELVKSYLVSKAIDGLSKNTVKNYQGILMAFLRTISKPVDQLTANDIRVWLFNYETKRHVGKHTMEHYRMVISEFFYWACAEGWLQKNPMEMIKHIKYPVKQKKAMSQLELEYMREACKNPQESAVVEVLYSTGCRVSELSNLKKSDVDWDKREVTLFGKGSKYRTSYLNAKAFVALQKYLATRSDSDDHLIVSSRAPHHSIGKSGFERMVKKIASRAGEKVGVHVTPHVFRHTTATIALNNGMPVQDVQRVLGHTNINTTMVYAKASQADVKSMHTKCVM